MKIEIESNDKLGKLYGHDVYIDLTNITYEARRKELQKCQEFFERSFKHADFIDTMKDIFNPKD